MKREKRDVSNSWELHEFRLIHLPRTSVVIANKRSVQLERTNIAFPLRRSSMTPLETLPVASLEQGALPWEVAP